MKNLNIADLVKPGSAKKTATVPLKPASRKNGAAFASLLKNNTGSGKVSPKLNKGLNLVARFEINNSKLPANGEKVKNRGDAPPAPPVRNGLKKGLSGKSVEKEPINAAASPAMMMTPRGIPKTLEQFIKELSAKGGSGSAAMETAGAEKQKGLFNMVKALEKALVARKGKTAPLNFKTSFTINNGKNVQTVRLEKEGNVLRLSAPSSARSLINRMKPDFKQMLARYFKPVDAREAPPLKLKISFNASAKTAVPAPPSAVKTGKPSAKGGAPAMPSGGRTAGTATAKPVPAVKVDSAPSIGAKGEKTAVPVPPSVVKTGKPSAKGGMPAVNSGGRTAGMATAKPVPAVKVDSTPAVGAKGEKATVPVPPSAVKTGKPSAKGGTPAVNSGGQTTGTATAKSTPTVKGDEVPVGKKPFAGAQAAKNAGHKPVALTEEQSASTSKAVGKGDLRETKQEINSAMPKSRLAAEKAGNESIATAADKADRAAGNKIKGRAPLQHADAGHRESVINKNDSNAQVLTKGTAAPGVAEEGKQNNILKSSVNRNREDMPKAPPVRPEQAGKEETTASRQGASSRAGGTVPEEQSGIKIPLSKKEGADLAAARSAELRSSEKQASREKPSGGSAFSGRENGSSPFTGKKASATENISKATVTEEAARTDFSRQLFEQSRDIPETPSTTRTRPLIKAQTLADIIVRHQNRVMGNQRMIVDGGRLGELEVRIDEQSKGKTLHIYVENESARQEVQKMAPAILNGLQARDIPVANVLVDYDRHRDGQKKSQQKATEKNITLNKKEEENEEHSTHIKPPRNYGYNTVEFVA